MRRTNLILNEQPESPNPSDLDGKATAQAELKKRIHKFRRMLLKTESSKFHKKGSATRIKEEILKIANLLIKATNQRNLPIDLDLIRRKMLIHTIIDNSGPAYFSAELIPDKMGFVLKIEKMNKARKRATIAHEIGHTLFYDVTRLPPTRILRYKPRTAEKDKEEWIAWDFARELLLPEILLINDLGSTEYPLSLFEIVDLARKVGVSVEILCHRLIRDLGFWDPCVFIVSDIQNGRFFKNAKVYRTVSFPRFSLRGEKGLINLSPELKKIVKKVYSTHEEYDSCFIEFQGIQLWAKLLRYFNNPQRVLCLLELPFVDMWNVS